mgnify:CR=1 FL=1
MLAAKAPPRYTPNNAFRVGAPGKLLESVSVEKHRP